MMQERSQLAARLRAARAYADLDQSVVAEALGVNRSTYSAWERGDTPSAAFQVEGVIRTVAELCELPAEFFTAEWTELVAGVPA